MQPIRFSFDKAMRAGIKLLMLTGVTFTVTACYGPMIPPDEREPEYQEDSLRLEQQLAIEPQEVAELND